jgi:hypothetical protein
LEFHVHGELPGRSGVYVQEFLDRVYVPMVVADRLGRLAINGRPKRKANGFITYKSA